MPDTERDDEQQGGIQAPEDRPGEIGAEGGSETAQSDKLPGAPDSGDDSPLGDSDQHSTG